MNYQVQLKQPSLDTQADDFQPHSRSASTYEVAAIERREIGFNDSNDDLGTITRVNVRQTVVGDDFAKLLSKQKLPVGKLVAHTKQCLLWRMHGQTEQDLCRWSDADDALRFGNLGDDATPSTGPATDIDSTPDAEKDATFAAFTPSPELIDMLRADAKRSLARPHGLDWRKSPSMMPPEVSREDASRMLRERVMNLVNSFSRDMAYKSLKSGQSRVRLDDGLGFIAAMEAMIIGRFPLSRETTPFLKRLFEELWFFVAKTGPIRCDFGSIGIDVQGVGEQLYIDISPPELPDETDWEPAELTIE